MNATPSSESPESLNDWFLRRLAEIRMGKPTPPNEQYFPTGNRRQNDEPIGIASQTVRELYSLKEEVKNRGKRLAPSLPRYEEALEENRRIFDAALEVYEMQLGLEHPIQGGELRVIRRWEVVAPKPKESHGHKLESHEPGPQDAVQSIMIIAKHVAVLKRVFGPELERLLRTLRNLG